LLDVSAHQSFVAAMRQRGQEIREILAVVMAELSQSTLSLRVATLLRHD
jgi:hypothetical protein